MTCCIFNIIIYTQNITDNQKLEKIFIHVVFSEYKSVQNNIFSSFCVSDLVLLLHHVHAPEEGPDALFLFVAPCDYDCADQENRHAEREYKIDAEKICIGDMVEQYEYAHAIGM